jgi:hypothetical protein
MSGVLRFVSQIPRLAIVAALAATAPTEAQATRKAPAVVDAPRVAAVQAQAPAARVNPPDRGLLQLRIAPRRNLEQDAEQFQMQCRPIIAVELHRLRAACDPSPVQRRRILDEGLKFLKVVATKDAQDRQNLQVGRLDDSYTHPDPRTLVVNALSQAAREHVSPDQAARLAAELTQRDEFHKQAIVRNLVVQFDEILSLSSDQRDKISEALAREWSDGWYSAIEQLHLNDNFLRSLPTGSYWPVLDARQRSFWMDYIQSATSLRVTRGFVQKVIMDPNGPMLREELGGESESKTETVPHDAQVR